MAGVTKGFPPTMFPLAQQQENPDGTPRDTTALMNPIMDQWFKALADAEGQTPDESGVTHLNLTGDPRQKNSPSLAALKGLV